MEYLFKKDGTKYTRGTVDETADYIDKHGFEALLMVLKDLDYPYFEDQWNRQISSTISTRLALTRYLNQLNLPAYRDFYWEDTDGKFKEKLMPPEAKRIKEKLDVTHVSKTELDTLLKDRLDFGFDSIYFRYAILADEVARLRAKESKDYDKEHSRAETQKMHFYNCLEQLLRAHDNPDGTRMEKFENVRI